MAVLGALLGLMAGILLWAATKDLAPLLYCGVIGGLCGWVWLLGKRVRKLETDRAERWQPSPAQPSPASLEPAPKTRRRIPATPPPAAPRTDAPASTPPTTAGARSNTILERALEAAKSWFTTGNVPVKLGVLVSLFGVGFFIKYAIDRQLFVFPLWARLALVAAFGLALFGIGWRLRQQRPVYALSLQGGGMAVLYLTIYAAAEYYAILPGTAALALMVIVTAASGFAAVRQDSRTLIVLAMAGGFAAPLLVAAETGSHIALFTYYAVLNGAILSVAWFKTWRMLNLLGFAFTFVIASLWGYYDYQPEDFATTEPFLVLFVLTYIGIAVLFARRQPPRLRGFVDSALVFGPPLLGFALQARLLENAASLAWAAAALAALYAVLGTLTWRTQELRALAWAFIGLALLFLTLTFPLAFDAQWTAVSWAAQGAILAWFSTRNRTPLLAVTGAALQLAAAASYLVQPGLAGNVELAVLNGQFLGAVLLAATGWIVGASIDRGPLPANFRTTIARLALGWGGIWWFAAGIREIGRSVDESAAAWLGFVAVSALAAAFGARWMRWSRLAALAQVLLPTMVVFLVVGVLANPHPFADFGWLAWPLAFAVQYALMRFRESDFPDLAPFIHVVAYWVLAGLAASEAWWLADRAAGGDWPPAAAAATAAGIAWAAWRVRDKLSWPFERQWPAYGSVGVPVLAITAAGAILLANLASPGNSAPLLYLPLLNPLAVAAGIAGIVLRMALGPELLQRGSYGLQFAATLAVLLLLSAEVARGVHHFAGVPFSVQALSASPTFQAGLSLVWGAAGLAGMVAGAVLARRAVWISGAAVMGLVIVKLFLVELGNAGTLARVVSFLGVGVLLLVVGYFAPVPKARVAAAEDAAPTP